MRTPTSPRPPSVLALLLAVLIVAACSSIQSPGEQIDDATITTRVKAKLAADPEINPFNIDVDTDNGVVTLRGQVEDSEAKAEASKLARSTSGVRSVRNEITIGETTAETRVLDAALVTEIEGRLAADPELSAFDIDVDVNQGVVTLSGTVKSEGARVQALQIAQQVDGVLDVNAQPLAVVDGSGGGSGPCYEPKCKCDDGSCKESCCVAL